MNYKTIASGKCLTITRSNKILLQVHNKYTSFDDIKPLQIKLNQF